MKSGGSHNHFRRSAHHVHRRRAVPREDIADIAAHFYDHGALNLHFSTNATLRSRTLAGVRRIAAYAADARVIVVASIDGPREIHDDIRMMPGVFDKTVTTVRELIAKTRTAKPGRGCHFTFTAFNQGYWRETVDFLRHDLGVDTVNIGFPARPRRPARRTSTSTNIAKLIGT